jgi:hypothetical protein
MTSDPVEVRDGGEKKKMEEWSIGVIQSDMLKRAGKKWVMAAFAG